ncbi:MAG TPA: PhnD/SsuA/transferrin family substrate-binding protein [Rhizobiaceae bacterium]|nr:PhnD/SsuA/transferrin family substrate-binding protein [Rhizobiaceae bacterium]
MLRLLAAAAIALTAFTANAADKIRFAVTDIEGLEQLQTEYGPFRDALSAATGYEIEFFAVNSRTAAVEALNADQVDMVLTGPAEYVVMKELTDAQIVVAWQRPDYFAQIVTLAGGEIKTAADLKGKKVTFGEVGSTSQHLGPAQALADLGLKYGEDYEALIIKRNTAIEALIRGEIAAVGMNFGHLNGAREAYPDVAFKVVARGPDLPDDILVASKSVSADIVAKMRDTFLKDGKSLMEAVLKGEDTQKYRGGFFIATVNDSDYDYVRSMYRAIGVESFSSFVGE